MPELLRPPVHRGPLIAAGGVVLAVGLALTELRLRADGGDAAHAALLGLPGMLLLALGLQFPFVGGKPAASASALMTTGLLLVLAALVRLAGDVGFGDAAWIGLVFGTVALGPAVARRSAAAALLASVAVVVALLTGWRWLFDAVGPGVYRWLLLLCALALAIGSLALRAPLPRHQTQLVNAAGLCLVAIVLTPPPVVVLGDAAPSLPLILELAVLAGGCGLVAYGAVDREPGPVLIGIAVLGAFLLAVVGERDTVLGWPLVLLALGTGVLLAGLRPRDPLPPEPEPGATVPLVATSIDDLTTPSDRRTKAWPR